MPQKTRNQCPQRRFLGGPASFLIGMLLITALGLHTRWTHPIHPDAVSVSPLPQAALIAVGCLIIALLATVLMTRVLNRRRLRVAVQ